MARDLEKDASRVVVSCSHIPTIRKLAQNRLTLFSASPLHALNLQVGKFLSLMKEGRRKGIVFRRNQSVESLRLHYDEAVLIVIVPYDFLEP